MMLLNTFDLFVTLTETTETIILTYWYGFVDTTHASDVCHIADQMSIIFLARLIL